MKIITLIMGETGAVDGKVGYDDHHGDSDDSDYYPDHQNHQNHGDDDYQTQ